MYSPDSASLFTPHALTDHLSKSMDNKHMSTEMEMGSISSNSPVFSLVLRLSQYFVGKRVFFFSSLYSTAVRFK